MSADDSLGTLVGDLAADAKGYARAEWNFYRAIAVTRARTGGVGIALVLLALFIAHAAVVALAVGALIALSAELGAWGATALVVLVAFALAGLLGWLGWTRLSGIADPIA